MPACNENLLFEKQKASTEGQFSRERCLGDEKQHMGVFHQTG